MRLLPLLLLPLTALADILITSPTAGEVLTGGTTITVSWKESGSKPLLEDFTTYSLSLCMGSNKEPQCNTPLGAANPKIGAGVTSAKVVVPAEAAGNGVVVFFIQMNAVPTAGGSFLTYSPRFTLTGMTGTTSPAILALQKTSAGAAAPPTVNEVLKADASQDPELINGNPSPEYRKKKAATPYAEQEDWKVKFAPMQKQPGTVIKEEGKMERQFPTSSYSVFKRKQAPTPGASTTYTVGWDYKDRITSAVNWASPAPRPNGGELKKRWEL